MKDFGDVAHSTQVIGTVGAWSRIDNPVIIVNANVNQRKLLTLWCKLNCSRCSHFRMNTGGVFASTILGRLVSQRKHILLFVRVGADLNNLSALEQKRNMKAHPRLFVCFECLRNLNQTVKVGHLSNVPLTILVLANIGTLTLALLFNAGAEIQILANRGTNVFHVNHSRFNFKKVKTFFSSLCHKFRQERLQETSEARCHMHQNKRSFS